MIFPNFQSGMRKVSARELQNLSDAVRALWNMRGGPGINITKSLSGITLSAQNQEHRTSGLVRNCAIYKKIGNEDEMLTVRRVGYGQEPPSADGTGPYVWADAPFLAYPFFGKKVLDYRPFEPETDEPQIPTQTTDFLHVQAESFGHVVWFPATSAGIMRAIIRWLPSQTGFEQIIYVQKLEPNGSGGYAIVGDVFDVLVPAGMLSRNFYPMRFMPDVWTPAAPMIWLFEIDGIWSADQTTRFSLAPVDQNYPVDDCWIAQ